MAFPTSPTNGQQANINGITYTYSNTLPAWTVSTSVSNTFVSISVSGNVNSGNILNTGLISTTGNITGGNIVTGGVLQAPVVKLAAASGGSIELVPTNTASTFTVTVPAVTGTIVLTSTATVLTGAVNFFAMSTTPSGWLKANGAAVSRTTYADLFTAIGTTFGVGDGTTTFNVPDMRGYFPRGWVDNGSIDSGRAFGSTQTDALQGHNHEYFAGNGGGGSFNISPYAGGVAQSQALAGLANPNQVADVINSPSYGTARVASETRPVNVAFLACIKY